VIHRKVTDGFRSDWGANAYADLLSVIATSKIKGQRVFETLVNLMGRPVLQFLNASSREQLRANKGLPQVQVAEMSAILPPAQFFLSQSAAHRGIECNSVRTGSRICCSQTRSDTEYATRICYQL
jgi:hypothetical protein